MAQSRYTEARLDGLRPEEAWLPWATGGPRGGAAGPSEGATELGVTGIDEALKGLYGLFGRKWAISDQQQRASHGVRHVTRLLKSGGQT